MKRFDLEMIGSIGGELPDISSEEIASLYAGESKKLTHGATFTGKTATVIHVNDRWVLKYNRNRSFSSLRTAREWCRRTLEREREYHVYHPLRTWIVLFSDGGKWQAANLTPRLTPLHATEGNIPEHALHQLVDMYCRFSAAFDKRLDEGLSNFALDGERLYYLDDDIFGWDEYLSFVAMLCQWMRAYADRWFTTELAASLGARIRDTLSASRNEFAAEQIHLHLKDQFLPAAAEPVRDALLDGLFPARIHRIAAAAKTSDEHKHVGLRMDRSIGLLADIHANLPALEAVLAELDKRGVQQWLVLGDVVGYGPDPEACIRLLQARGALVIRGNHDHYIGHRGHGRVAMSQSARWAAQWTIRRLSEKQLEWLRDLPLKHEVGDILAVHGAPVDRSFFNGYIYEMTHERNLRYMQEHGIRFCMHGHSHVRGVYAARSLQEYLPLCTDRHQELTEFEACLINPGSVGQPRTGLPGADAAVFDPVHHTLELIHVEYEMSEVIARMRAHDFPKQLISRLETGR